MNRWLVISIREELNGVADVDELCHFSFSL